MGNKLKYAVITQNSENENHYLLKRNFIVLKNEFGDIIEWTNYHRYITPSKENVNNIQKNLRKKFDYVSMFLNYVFFEENYESLVEIDKKVIERFLNAYGQLKLKNDNNNVHRKKETVKRCRDAIVEFVENLISEKIIKKINKNDLFIEEQRFNYGKRKYETVKRKNFEIECIDNYDRIYRDITYKAMDIIMRQIESKHKNILAVASLGAYVGLRPSAGLNVRREDSNLGPGIEFEIIDGEVMNAYVNIQHEYNLRSDLIDIGGIKKERKQKIHPYFLGDFCRGYQMYMRYMEGRKYESKYGPLTVNLQGKAMTYDSYYYHFKNVIKEVIPIMLSSEDQEVVAYGMMIQQYGLSMHIFRHYFSMRLADNGASLSEMMEFRGDTSPESSLVYLQNKSDLTRKLEKVSNEVFAYNLWRASKKYEEENNE